ncbi:MAG: SRPBCC family protein [Thaumarchaeota archaeon]|nr:SRPBCC family protein [Nitrososphaerota archaeon]
MSEIDVMCSPQRLYEFVTTPDNWVGTHPVTKTVRGETENPAGLGMHWIEVIEAPSGRQFEAEWRVVRADSPRLWEIQADNFGGIPATVTITYLIEGGRDGSVTAAGSTHFQRDMVTSLPEDFQVSDVLRAALTSRESHDQYLRAIKERIEGA